ncbi:hypothetical protein A3B32_00290 [Candidatus Uhrbacteria bacterium RIFCSPLOWO2_01_FULL_53_9]|uniref:DUF218 domain-containing protein n=3 Tax=Candidatus Uhriibacteriota TaxID=1752732 RepID=A0A1F7UWQ3_9BACT|nr:MAG: hypothetical protein A3C17_02150 [Candidatus Uhrbacteria bacterium RIFCSPHIGHO2_02_FULL_53_13]OGL82686.1 MAG: hypothetical protein A3B32_00290 [Candidatus Uhrbacteria bacterium RIFCSPLOWO2_01_FULL_53_9]OGL89798.1 MAG: hypothetical protein A3I45_04260 [Candidatus Uhrbacteria bacterium RIFCSPLOWO2_02_FULL_53_10]
MLLLQKLIELLLLPPAVVVLLLLVVVGVWHRSRAWAWRILLLAVVVLYVFSIEPVAYALTQSLQGLYASSTAIETASEEPDAIVVLAGGSSSAFGVQELSGASWRRLWRGYERYRFFEGRVPVMYSGGSGDPFVEHSLEANIAKGYLESMGVLPHDAAVEDQSRTTFESARALNEQFFSADKDAHRTIELVTSATHMRRAQATFEAVGFDVRAVLADFQTAPLKLDLFSFVPTHASLFTSVTALHEWLGIAYYSLAGRL